MKALFMVLIGAALAAHTTARAGVSPKTLDNLNTAFQGESNASLRYEVFAKQADGEGHAQVARLFRAASKAESIHRDTHKRAILELGGRIQNFKLDEVTVGTTAENLRAAIKGERYERDTMYPGFMALAKQDEAKSAIRAFLYAQKAEAEHAALYQASFPSLGKNANAPLYVCKSCGYTVTKLPERNCVSCREAVNNYELIT